MVNAHQGDPVQDHCLERAGSARPSGQNELDGVVSPHEEEDVQQAKQKKDKEDIHKES